MKTCSKCGNEYPATTEYWHRNKSRKDGLADYCKPCNRAASLEATRKLVTDPSTGEVIKAGLLSCRKLVTDPSTGEVIKAGALARRKRRATEEGREAHREATRKHRQTGKWQEYLDNNPLVKLRLSLANLIRNSMKAKGWSKSTKTAKLLGCSFQEFKTHIESQFKDGMSWENAGQWHYDHILCCNCAENEDELNALQHWSNFQPMWGSENISKGASLPPDWKERKAKLMAIYWERFPERREAA